MIFRSTRAISRSPSRGRGGGRGSRDPRVTARASYAPILPASADGAPAIRCNLSPGAANKLYRFDRLCASAGEMNRADAANNDGAVRIRGVLPSATCANNAMKRPLCNTVNE